MAHFTYLLAHFLIMCAFLCMQVLTCAGHIQCCDRGSLHSILLNKFCKIQSLGCGVDELITLWMVILNLIENWQTNVFYFILPFYAPNGQLTANKYFIINTGPGYYWWVLNVLPVFARTFCGFPATSYCINIYKGVNECVNVCDGLAQKLRTECVINLTSLF